MSSKIDISSDHKKVMMPSILHICQLYLGNLAEVKNEEIDIDQKSLWRVIQAHKLQAALYEVSQRTDLNLSGSFRNKLEARSKKTLLRKLFHVKEIISIQTAHEKEGIYVIPYKGIAIGELFYNDIHQRDFVDIDFAIEKNHISASAEIMRSLGYEELKEESNFDKLEESRAYHIDYSWVKHDSNGKILCNAEIHWQATNSALISPEAFTDLKAKSEKTVILSKELRLFSKVDNAYLMILHHGLVDNWFQLRHLVDLVKTLRSLTADETDALIQKLEKEKMLICFYYGVQLSRDLLNEHFDINLPASLPKYKKYLEAVTSGTLVGKWSDNKSKLFYYFLLLDNHRERFKALLKFCKYSMKEVRFKMTKPKKQQ